MKMHLQAWQNYTRMGKCLISCKSYMLRVQIRITTILSRVIQSKDTCVEFAWEHDTCRWLDCKMHICRCRDWTKPGRVHGQAPSTRLAPILPYPHRFGFSFNLVFSSGHIIIILSSSFSGQDYDVMSLNGTDMWSRLTLTVATED